MRILCINPSIRSPTGWGVPYCHMPLGLAYIAAVLQKDNEVLFLDANAEGTLSQSGDFYYAGLQKDEIVKRVADLHPDAICMTIVFTFNSTNALEILKAIKEKLPTTPIVVGGMHVTVTPKETLEGGGVDIVVMGEGERTVAELFGKLAKNEDLKDVKGIAYMEDGKVRINPERELIRDLDSLPFPAIELLPLDKYFETQAAGNSQRKRYTYNDRWTSIITSRGCPMNCVFCSIHLTMGQLFRPRSPENVLLEMERDYHEFGIRHFNIEDDNMSWNIERFQKICDMIVAKGLKITWSASNGLRADRVDDATIKKMKASGCKRVFVAPESGSQRVVNEVIDKRMKLEDVEKAVELFSKNGILVDAAFIIGLPGETKAEMEQTIKFAKRLRKKGASHTGIAIAAPLYGTRLYKLAVEKGYFDPKTDPARITPLEANIQTPEWTREYVAAFWNMANWSVNLTSIEKVTHVLKKWKKAPEFMSDYVKFYLFDKEQQGKNRK
jgi:anaerobic magnesium-protoporphyrin IX monomethyl ester cyclase